MHYILPCPRCHSKHALAATNGEGVVGIACLRCSAFTPIPTRPPTTIERLGKRMAAKLEREEEEAHAHNT